MGFHQQAQGPCDSVSQAPCLCEQPPTGSPARYFTRLPIPLQRAWGAVCLENFVVSLGKWVFAKLHRVGEVPGSPCAPCMIRVRRGEGEEWEQFSCEGARASLGISIHLRAQPS